MDARSVHDALESQSMGVVALLSCHTTTDTMGDVRMHLYDHVWRTRGATSRDVPQTSNGIYIVRKGRALKNRLKKRTKQNCKTNLLPPRPEGVAGSEQGIDPARQQV